jgi:hypothetical protein
MVEVNYQMVLSTLQTAGLLVGIFYYLMVLRNQQKNRMLEMVSRRAEQANNYAYQKMVRDVFTTAAGWSTPEEYYEKYNFKDTPELTLSRAIVQNNLNHWGFLYREGIIDENFIDRLYNPWHIISFWENFNSLLLHEREVMGNPEVFKDLEHLYNAMKKKYPHLNKDTKFAFQHWREN